MSDTKEKVLYELLKNKGEYVSGETIADIYGLSRVAISKAVKSLIADGYVFDAVRNKGYAIITTEDILSSVSILNRLNDKKVTVEVFEELSSTITYAKERVHSLVGDAIIVANSQTAGRGRFGKTFLSCKNDGMYMSAVFSNPKIFDAGIFTMLSAVAVTRVIDKYFGVDTQIKWVNDVYLDGKKLCGILTEGVLNFEVGAFDWVIIGIGINLYNKQFDDSIKDIAASLHADKEKITRNEIIAAIFNELSAIISDNDKSKTIAEYKKKSFILGKKISAMQGGKMISGTASDILDNGNLVVEGEKSKIFTLTAGEVSIKWN